MADVTFGDLQVYAHDIMKAHYATLAITRMTNKLKLQSTGLFVSSIYGRISPLKHLVDIGYASTRPDYINNNKSVIISSLKDTKNKIVRYILPSELFDYSSKLGHGNYIGLQKNHYLVLIQIAESDLTCSRWCSGIMSQCRLRHHNDFVR